MWNSIILVLNKKKHIPSYQKKQEGKTTLQRIYDSGNVGVFIGYLHGLQYEAGSPEKKIDFLLNETYREETILYQALKSKNLEIVFFLLTLEVGKEKSFVNHHPVGQPTPIELFLNVPDAIIEGALKDTEPPRFVKALKLSVKEQLRIRVQFLREGIISYFEENGLDKEGTRALNQWRKKQEAKS
ncbi:MAG: hypothetical protein AAF335_02500 [Bacteroidota bacterium]